MERAGAEEDEELQFMLASADPTSEIAKREASRNEAQHQSILAKERKAQSRRRLSAALDSTLAKLTAGTPWGRRKSIGEVDSIPSASAGVVMLQELMRDDLKKVSSLFHDYDADNSGTLERDEFRVMVHTLLQSKVTADKISREWCDGVFDEVDTLGNGTITERQLTASLRRGANAIAAAKAPCAQTPVRKFSVGEDADGGVEDF